MGGDTIIKVPVFSPRATSGEINRDIDLPPNGYLLSHNRLSELPIKDVFRNDRPYMIGVAV